jgi:hypothetical protein
MTIGMRASFAGIAGCGLEIADWPGAGAGETASESSTLP